MVNLVIVAIGVQETGYTADHIRLLLRRCQIKGQKIGGTWLVDLDDLKQHQQKMEELGTKRFNPTRDKD